MAAPILQPFADEFAKLAGNLNDFAESDDFKSISDQVGKMATTAAKSLDDLITGTDWKGFASNAKTSLDSIQTTLTSLAASAVTLSAAVGKTADALGIAYHGLAVGVDAAVGGIAEFGDKAVTAAQVLDSLAEGTETASQKFEGLHSALQSIDDSASTKASENMQGVADDALALAGASDAAAAGITKQSDAAVAATPAITAHAAATQDLAKATGLLVDPLSLVPNYLGEAGAFAAAAAPSITSVAAAVADLATTLPQAQTNLANAVKAFQDLQASGNATPAALKAAGDAVADASLQLSTLSQTAASASSSILTAFKNLGVVSQQQLETAAASAKKSFDEINADAANTAAGLADKQNAFLAYAKTALAASAELDQGTKDTVEGNLESQAAILGVTDSLKKLETQSDASSAALVSDTENYSKSLSDLGDQFDKNEKAFEAAGNAAQYADTSQQEALAKTTAAAKDAQDAIDSYSKEGGSSLAELDNALQNTRQQLLNVSAAAASAFDTKLVGDFFDAFDSTGIGFAKVIQGMTEAAASVNQEISDQRTQLQAQIALINQIGTAGVTSFGDFGTSAASAAANMLNLSNLISQGNYNAGLLGQQELAPLQQALEAAAERTKALSDQFAQTVSDLQDSLDQADGDLADAENRRYQLQLANLKSQAQAAGELNTQVYQQAVAQAEQLHELNMQQIEQENAAKNGTTAPTSSGGGTGGFGGGTETFDTSGGSGFGASNQPSVVVNVNVTGSVIGGTEDDIAKALAPHFVTALKAIQARTTGPLLGK